MAFRSTLAHWSADRAVCVAARRAGDAVATFGPDHRIRRANRPAARLFGGDVAPGSSLGALLTRVGLADCAGALDLPLRAVVQTRLEPVLLECLALPHSHGGVLRALVLPEDRVEWPMSAARFLAVAAHEIRNPLAAIRALVQSLGDPETITQEEAGVALTELDRLNFLLDDLLNLLHPRPDLMEPLSLPGIAEQAAAALRPLLRAKGQRLTVHLPALDDVIVLGSAQRLLQVGLNLIRNASEAAPSGGSIVVRVSRTTATALLEVLDDGPGFLPGAKAHLWEPFYTTKPQGTGLGLAICRRIAEQHGGRLEVGDANPGARVGLYLPFAN